MSRGSKNVVSEPTSTNAIRSGIQTLGDEKRRNRDVLLNITVFLLKFSFL